MLRIGGGYGHAADVDGTDAVDRVGIGERVAVDGEQIGVVAGGQPALAVAEPDHPGRRRGDHAQRLGLPDPYLAQLVRRRLRPEAGRLLHVAGSDVAGDLAGLLREAGFAVERVVLYEARPVAGFSAPAIAALQSGLIDFALFFSPRTAAVFLRLAEQAGIAAALRAVTAVSISAAADRALGDLAFASRLVADRPDQEGLLGVLDSVLAERRHR